jgi:adenylate cyclase
VFEGNVGVATTRDFTILGNVVNLAARLESLTRQLNVRLALDESVVRRASSRRRFLSLGRHDLQGQSRPTEVFTVKSLPKLRVASLQSRIDSYSRQKR